MEARGIEIPAGVPRALVDAVRAAYAEPPRAYHDFSHVEEVLALHADVARRKGWRQPRETWLAALFHDAVYVAGRKDNEARSAALARELVTRHGMRDVDLARVEGLILLTARHGSLKPGDVDDEAALFLDLDMAILAAEPARFDAYDAGVAREYAPVVPGPIYRWKRKRFLRALLDSPRIFLADDFHARLDDAARQNLRRVLR